MWRSEERSGDPDLQETSKRGVEIDRTPIGAHRNWHLNGVQSTGHGSNRSTKLQALRKLVRNERKRLLPRDFPMPAKNSLASRHLFDEIEAEQGFRHVLTICQAGLHIGPL